MKRSLFKTFFKANKGQTECVLFIPRRRDAEMIHVIKCKKTDTQCDEPSGQDLFSDEDVTY